MLSDIRTVEYLLEQWGKWAYINRGVNVYFPSTNAVERMRGSSGVGCSLTDAEAETVDAVVSTMRLDERKAHDALSLYYVAGLPYRGVAQELHTNHRAAQDWTEQGRVYVKAALRFGAPKVD